MKLFLSQTRGGTSGLTFSIIRDPYGLYLNKLPLFVTVHLPELPEKAALEITIF